MLRVIMDNPRNALYFVFFVGCLVVYKFLQARATGMYDFILTLSACLQTLAFSLLVIETRGSALEGLSEKTLWAFCIAHVARVSTTFWGEGYVPEDNTGDVFLYQIAEVLGILIVCFQILKLSALRSTHDVGQGLERWSMLIVMCLVSGVLAVMTKSTGHNDWYADMSWMFSVWLEAFALLPQVQLMTSGVQVDEAAAHFAAFTLAASVAFAVFWSYNVKDQYSDLAREGVHTFYWGILSAAAVRVLLCVGYLYLFSKAPNRGKGSDPFAEDIL